MTPISIGSLESSGIRQSLEWRSLGRLYRGHPGARRCTKGSVPAKISEFASIEATHKFLLVGSNLR